MITRSNTRAEIKAAKQAWSTEMWHKYGHNWKKELKRNTMKLYTFRQLRIFTYETV